MAATTTQTPTDAVREIEALCAFEERSPGSDSERRAALHLKGRLEALGGDAKLEAFTSRPNWALTHALHALLAIGGGLLAVAEPIPGAAIGVFAAISAYGDVSGAFLFLRRLTGRRSSQNVAGTIGDGNRLGTLILAAHYDAGRGGYLHGTERRRRFAALPRMLQPPLGPLAILVLAIALVAATALARVAGLEGDLLTVIQFIPTVGLIVAVPLLLDIELSDTVPGANDNASGVAVALAVADRLGGKLEHFELRLLLTGAGEAGAEGARAWRRRHRRELDREATAVINLDEVGAGTVRYTTGEGALYPRRSHKQLVELCDQIAADDDGGRFGARPTKRRTQSDAQPFRARRLPAITISCAGALGRAPQHHLPTDTPDRIDAAALERARDFCSELIERLDSEVGPELDLVEGHSTSRRSRFRVVFGARRSI